MIEVEGISRRFGDVQAVSDLSFRVERGEIVGLLGPNGAGKTTALRILATLLTPDTGTVRVDGVDALADPVEARSRLGYQTGDTGLYERLTPREFLRYFGQLHGIAKAPLESRLSTLVDAFGVSEFADRPCSTLSTGQKQRVTLARTMLHDPPAIVLDEPTSGLDIVSSAFILDRLREAAANGHAVLFSTHVLSEVELLCDRVVVIHRGRERASGTIEELLELTGEAQLSRAFLSLVDAADNEAA